MTTPIQRQYRNLKAENPAAILFFQLGDFYELFFEDAHLGSRLLGITLTARHRGTENEMPMAGFPIHSAEPYLKTFLDHGYCVAVADQVVNPEGVIERKVTRLLTPGTAVMENTTQAEGNFLAAVFPRKNGTKNTWALALAEVSTGQFRTTQGTELPELFNELKRYCPREILIPVECYEDEDFMQQLPNQALITCHTPPSEKEAQKTLQNWLGVENLAAFGLQDLALIVQACGALVQYLEKTLKKTGSHFQPPQIYDPQDHLWLTDRTIQHLEIWQPLQPDGHSLWSTLIKPLTAMGRRELQSWLRHPSKNLSLLQERQAGLRELQSPLVAQGLSEILKPCPDLLRILGRLTLERSTRADWESLRVWSAKIETWQQWLKAREGAFFRGKILSEASLADLQKVVIQFQQWLPEALPPTLNDPGWIRAGVDVSLDELRAQQDQTEAWLEAFLARTKRHTGLKTLRLGRNKAGAMYLELTKKEAEKAPADWNRTQILKNVERFSSPELAAYQQQVGTIPEEILRREQELRGQLVQQLLSVQSVWQKLSTDLAAVDALFSLARTADQYHWNLPDLDADRSQWMIINGRHPVLEKVQGPGQLVTNSLQMEEKTNRLQIITGPNMAGKSTFLRQNALIVLLAQIGSAVPAQRAELPLFDRVFTRLGASDNVSRGQSTFYLEMLEVAEIMHTARGKSLVLLDEVGRGTATLDGLSLAQAIIEYLHDQPQTFTLCATHYHELIEVGEALSAAHNFHVAVAYHQKELVWLHQLRPGGMSDSFGVEVAARVGLPSAVISRARALLKTLEKSAPKAVPSLFSAENSVTPAPEESAVLESLKHIPLDDLSPRQAWDQLWQWQKELKMGENPKTD